MLTNSGLSRAFVTHEVSTMDKLAQQLIKLGYTNPELREDIRPVLATLEKQSSSDPMMEAAAEAWARASVTYLKKRFRGANVKFDGMIGGHQVYADLGSKTLTVKVSSTGEVEVLSGVSFGSEVSLGKVPMTKAGLLLDRAIDALNQKTARVSSEAEERKLRDKTLKSIGGAIGSRAQVGRTEYSPTRFDLGDGAMLLIQFDPEEPLRQSVLLDILQGNNREMLEHEDQLVELGLSPQALRKAQTALKMLRRHGYRY
jgi:hypothetical protein